MYIVERGMRFVRGFLLSYGPTNLKKHFWEKEYSGGKWNFADNTVGDCVYRHLDKCSAGKEILDIGCGSGNTATEMADTYKSYVGVDISQSALDKAAARSKEVGRGDKNRFECSDFLAYVPSQQYDVILFRESLYHVPLGKVKATLERYSVYLKEGGVFIVRLFAASRDETSESRYRPKAMMGVIAAEFDVLERVQYDEIGHPTVMVFRPKPQPKN